MPSPWPLRSRSGEPSTGRPGSRDGIIDDGFRGWAAAVTAGELPANTSVTGHCYTSNTAHSTTLSNCEGDSNTSQQGTVIAETIVDMAPRCPSTSPTPRTRRA